jgi:hypothetical protein
VTTPEPRERTADELTLSEFNQRFADLVDELRVFLAGMSRTVLQLVESPEFRAFQTAAQQLRAIHQAQAQLVHDQAKAHGGPPTAG